MISILLNTTIDVAKLFIKTVNKALGLNTIDFKKLFQELGICNKSKEIPRLDNIIKEKYSIRYIFVVPIGVGLRQFTNNAEVIAATLGATEKDLRFKRLNTLIEVRVITGFPDAVYNPVNHKRKDFKVPLGYDLETNKLVLWDLTKSNNAHLYIAGSSGGGKSIMLRLILTHLINSKSKRDIELSIINTKRVDLRAFECIKHTKHYMSGFDGAEAFLEREIDEMERRYKLFEKHNVDDLKEFRDLGNRFPYRLIVIEEIGVYKDNKEFQKYLEILAQQGRGAGILLILVTQLPTHDIMKNTIKNNINSTIGLKAKDNIRSEIIAGEGANLQKLKGNGHAKLFAGDYNGTEFQGLYIDKAIMKQIIEQNKRVICAGTHITLSDNKSIPKE